MQNEQTPAAAAIAPAVDPQILADIAQAGGEFSAADVPAARSQGEPAAPVDPMLAGMIASGLLVTFNMLAKMRGEHWKLDAESANEAGAAYAAVLMKYFPNLQSGPEVTAIIVTAALVVPRVAMDKARSVSGGDDGAQPE